MKVEIEIPETDVIGLICTAIEGGMTRHWCRSAYAGNAESDEPPPKEWALWPSYWILFRGGTLEVECEHPKNDGVYVKRTVEPDAVKRALSLMARRHPRQFAEFMSDNADAITGDVFFQLLVYGEVIFG